MKRILFVVAILFLFFFTNISGFANQPPSVEFFSPQGTVKKVRQVSVRFSGQMVPFGDPRSLTDPFDIACPAPGTSRWADGKNWIYDFNADLPAGISCEFTLKTGLKSLAGAALAGQKTFTFSTGGPAIVRAMPYEGFVIDEEQIFILTLDAEPDIQSVLENVIFSVDGIADTIGVRSLKEKQETKFWKPTATKGSTETGSPATTRKSHRLF